MKTQLLILCFAAGLWSTGLRAQIMNESFEQWDAQTDYSTPLGWHTSNNFDYPDQVRQMFDGHYGLRSVMMTREGGLEHPASIWQQCTIEDVPQSMSFYVKGHLTQGDSIQVNTTVSDTFGNDLFVASKRLGPNTVNAGWSLHEIEFNQVGIGVPHFVEVHLYFTCDSVSSGFVQFDDVHVTATSVGITDDEDADDDAESDRLDIRYAGALFVTNRQEATTLCIYDMSGRLVEQVYVPANYIGELPLRCTGVGPCVAVASAVRKKLIIP